MTLELTHYDTFKRELALAKDIDEIKMIRDKAEALRLYIKQQGESLEIQNSFAEIKLRAERRAGELLTGMEMNEGGRPPENRLHDVTSLPTLEELGISKVQSHRWKVEAELPESAFEQHVAVVKSNGQELTSKSVLDLAYQRRISGKKQIIANLSPPNGKYHTIVIDPPWPMDKSERTARPLQGPVLDYPTMSLDEISKFPVGELADADCHIYLWTTHRFLPLSFEILDGWGFKYHCLLTWVKNVGFTPFSWMFSTEHCLFGWKGKFELNKMGVRVDFNAPAREHSRKPEIFYEIVREISPLPRAEIFSREIHDGFKAWGNEVDKFTGEKD